MEQLPRRLPAGVAILPQGQATPQMAAYRLARREPPSRASAALQLLTRVLPLPASCASPKAPTVGALARLGGSESANITLKEYYYSATEAEIIA